jgi:hypothetical protein
VNTCEPGATCSQRIWVHVFPRALPLPYSYPTDSSLVLTGVGRDKGRWRAYARFQGKNVHLGCFATEEEAARAWDAEMIRRGKGDVVLNFPDVAEGGGDKAKRAAVEAVLPRHTTTVEQPRAQAAGESAGSKAPSAKSATHHGRKASTFRGGWARG